MVTPGQTKHEDERREQMRAVQALNAYAPGRVSHRLTVSHRYARHWIAPGDAAGPFAEMDIHKVAAEFEELGVFGRGETNESRVVRPLTMDVAVPPADVLNSSHGRLRWSTEIVPTANSDQSLVPPATSALVDIVEAVKFFTHGALTHVEVRRWASESEFETHTNSGTRRGVVRFVDEGGGAGRVAIGLAVDVDAIAVDVRIPDRLLSHRDVAPKHLRGLRVERFRDRILASGAAGLLGHFNTERLVDAALRVVVVRALASASDIESAYQRLCAEDGLAAAIFEEASGYANDDSVVTSAGLVELRAALADGTALHVLDEAVPTLWEEIDESWDSWASERLATTVGAVVHAALQDLCPEYDGDEVVVDVERGYKSGMLRVWLSEQTIGGGGLIQEALRRIGDSPRTFFDLMTAATEPSVDEMVDDELARIARLAMTDAAVGDAIADVREAVDHLDRTTRFDCLLEVLRAAGVFVCHPVVSALSVRALRPGGDERIDRTIVRLLDDWDHLEATFGLDLDLRTFAALRASDPEFDRSSGMSAPPEDAGAWRAGQITGLLWQRGAALRSQALRAPNPFVTLPRPDPLLLRACLRSGETPVDVGDIVAALASDGPLARNGELDVRAAPDDARLLRQALLSAACTPIEAGPLLHYPRAAGVRRDAQGVRARLVLDLVGE